MKITDNNDGSYTFELYDNVYHARNKKELIILIKFIANNPDLFLPPM
jgi:hypothetical protein